MNTLEILSSLATHPITKHHFVGVYPSNKIPKSFFRKTNHGKGVIFNFDPKGYPGSHWAALWMTPQCTLEYFDSFGRAPLHAFIYKSRRHIRFSRKRLQSSSSTVCGAYVMYFILQKALKKTFESIVKPFTKDYTLNDQYVLATVCDIFQRYSRDGINLCH